MKSLLFFMLSLPAFTCEERVLFRVQEAPQTYREYYEQACLNHSIFKIVSASCLKKESCQAVQRYQHSKPLPARGGVGSPFHLRCRQAGGVPFFADYFLDETWVSSAFCRFSDNTFISLFNKIDFMKRK